MRSWVGWLLAAGVAVLSVAGVLTMIWLYLVFAGGLTPPWPTVPGQ
jgi:hypothetical protein